MEQSRPLRFGPYIVVEQIGSGGMGAVYRARDERLEREVAVKMLHRHLTISGAEERFLREARAVSSLNHPNICTVFDIGDHDGDLYMVMELLEGESLKDRIARDQVADPSELEAVAMQSALALAAAHSKGIVHRDIKPANLFLVANPLGEVQLKVLDFGLAKTEDETIHNDGLTRTGSTVGTVEYMSPEQARGEPLDPRSDLFSLGAVLYELATGDVPFRGPTSAVVFAALLGSAPVPPRSSNTNISVAMDAIIRTLLEKALDARMQSANELIAALRHLHAPPIAAPPTTEPLSLAGPTNVEVHSPAAKNSMSQVATRQSADAALSDPPARPFRPALPSGVNATAALVRHEPVDDVILASSALRVSSVRDAQSTRWTMVAITLFLLLLLGGIAYYLSAHTLPAARAWSRTRSNQVLAMLSSAARSDGMLPHRRRSSKW